MLSATGARAQDSQYWTNHYGTRGELLGGTAMGSITDLSATYYNPGALSLRGATRFALSTDAFQLERVTIEANVPAKENPSYLRGGSAPSMFAVRITGDWLGKNKIAVSYLNRYEFNLNVVEHRIDSRDGLPSTPGPDDYAGEVGDNSGLDESWFGLTWARRLRGGVGFGVTQYFAYRSQSDRFQTLASLVAPDSSNGAGVVIVNQYNYWNVRALWKIGAALDLGGFNLAITATTPSVNFFGTGSRFVDFSTINVIPPGDSVSVSLLASDAKKDVNARYESPLSIAAGVSRGWGSTRLHFAIEWFDRQESFVAMDTGVFLSQTGGNPIDTSLHQELNSVTNWGVGIEQTIKESLQFYGAFFTDNSGYVSSEKTQLSITNWDINHVTLGSAFTVRSIDFTLGVSYGRGRQPSDRIAAITNLPELGLTATDPEVAYTRLKFIIGITLPLGDSSSGAAQ